MKEDYIFDKHNDQQELERLILLEKEFDQDSKATLDILIEQQDWHCLELGPGAGSIMKWLCDRVPDGKITAIDMNPRFIADTVRPNLEIREADIINCDLEKNTFDLIHARYVLTHIKEYEDVLKKLINALKPGGWIFLEEADHSITKMNFNDQSIVDAVSRVNQAILIMFKEAGKDPVLADKLSNLYKKYNLLNVKTNIKALSVQGETPLAKLMGQSISHLRDALIATGTCSDKDVNAYIECANNSLSRGIYYACIGTQGQKEDLTYTN